MLHWSSHPQVDVHSCWLRVALIGASALVIASGCRTTSNITAPAPPSTETVDQIEDISGRVTVDWPDGAKVALVPPDSIRLAAPDSALQVSGKLGVDWPSDVRLTLVPPEAIRLAAPATPLKADVTLRGPDTIQLEAPLNAVRARLEPDVIIAKLETDGLLDKGLDLNVKFDSNQLNQARVGVDWGSPPAVPITLTVLQPETKDLLPATIQDRQWLFGALVVACLPALVIRYLIGRPPDARQLVLTILAPWFVPMFLDMLGKPIMRDVGQNWGQWLVFFSYSIAASTLGGEFIAPVVSGFERFLKQWSAVSGAMERSFWPPR